MDDDPIRIASFPAQSINPYFRLYYGALASFGVDVQYVTCMDAFQRALDQGEHFDALHLHWNLEQIWRTGARGYKDVACNLWKWMMFLRRLKRSRVALIWTMHELEPPDWGGRADILGYRLTAKAADLCIAHSSICLQAAIQRFALDRRKTLVIPIGTYDGVLVPQTTRQATCARWSIPTSSRLLLCFGDQRPRKGADIAADALAFLEEGYHLIIQGISADAATEWQVSLLNRYRANSRITFIGKLTDDSDLADILAAADCVLLPYRDIVGSSALSASVTVGTPVVTSDLPYFREVLHDEPEAAEFFKVGDSRDLSRAIARFFSIDDGARRAALRRLALRLQWKDIVRPVAAWLDTPGRQRVPRASAPTAVSSTC